LQVTKIQTNTQPNSQSLIAANLYQYSCAGSRKCNLYCNHTTYIQYTKQQSIGTDYITLYPLTRENFLLAAPKRNTGQIVTKLQDLDSPCASWTKPVKTKTFNSRTPLRQIQRTHHSICVI